MKLGKSLGQKMECDIRAEAWGKGWPNITYATGFGVRYLLNETIYHGDGRLASTRAIVRETLKAILEKRGDYYGRKINRSN